MTQNRKVRRSSLSFLTISILGSLLLLTFASSSANADPNAFFVRKTVAGRGVNGEAASQVTEKIVSAVQASGPYHLANSIADAGIVIRATVYKQNSKFFVRLDRTRNDRVLSSQQSSVSELAQMDGAIKEMLPATLSFKEGQQLPQVAAGHGPIQVDSHASDVVFVSESGAQRDVATEMESGAPAMAPGEVQKPIMNTQALTKHWVAALGPAWSTALLGNNGTKYNLSFAYTMPYYEHWNFQLYWDGNFNSNQMGTSDIITVGASPVYFFNDRLAAESLYARFDAGYGGTNRYEDGGISIAAAFGMSFYRDRPMAFNIDLRYLMLFTAKVSSGVEVNPNITQLRFGFTF